MPHCDDCGTYGRSLIPVGLVHMLCDGCADDPDDEAEEE